MSYERWFRSHRFIGYEKSSLKYSYFIDELNCRDFTILRILGTSILF